MKNGQYLYSIVYQTIKKEIIDGVYQTNMLPSERELCQRFAVERTTVRKALGLLVDDGIIEKKAGVGTRIVCDTSNAVSSSYDNRYVGFFIEADDLSDRKITQPYYSDLFYYLELECQKQDCQLIYASVNSPSSFFEMLRNQHYIAIVFITRTERSFITTAFQLSVPIILINEYSDHLLSISCDSADGAYQALQYLSEMGHSRIGIISGPPNYLSVGQKMMGTYKAIADFSLQISKKNTVIGDFRFQSGYDAVIAMYGDGTPRDELPTALFVHNDIMCLGAIRALNNLSLNVPDDVSIIGFDNMAQLQFTLPNLTTVDGNIAYIAKLAVDAAVNNTYSSCDRGAKIIAPVKLIKRGTVKRLDEVKKSTV